MRSLSARLAARFSARFILLVLAGTLWAPAPSAQFYVYALNSQGKVNVNGVEITKLSGGIKLNDVQSVFDLNSNSVIWNSTAIDGEDWWVFRTDGKLRG